MASHMEKNTRNLAYGMGNMDAMIAE